MKRTSRITSAGFTLIEVAIVVSITSVLFALSVTTIVALLRIQRQIEAEGASDAAVARLAERWRADAHAAASADCSDGCLLELGNAASIRYALMTTAVRREVRRAGAIEHRDSFVLGKDASVAFSQEGSGDKRLVILKVATQSGGSVGSSPSQAVEIAAAVNLYGRQ